MAAPAAADDLEAPAWFDGKAQHWLAVAEQNRVAALDALTSAGLEITDPTSFECWLPLRVRFADLLLAAVDDEYIAWLACDAAGFYERVIAEPEFAVTLDGLAPEEDTE